MYEDLADEVRAAADRIENVINDLNRRREAQTALLSSLDRVRVQLERLAARYEEEDK